MNNESKTYRYARSLLSRTTSTRNVSNTTTWREQTTTFNAIEELFVILLDELVLVLFNNELNDKRFFDIRFYDDSTIFWNSKESESKNNTRRRRSARTRRNWIACRIRNEKKKSLMTRRWSWFSIFSFKFWRRFCFLMITSLKFSKSISIIDSNANMTIDSITKVAIWIKNESAINTFVKSTKKEINVVKKRIKTSRFISSNIEFTIDSSKNANTKKIVTKNAKTMMTKEIDIIVTKNIETNETKNAKIMSDIESITKRWDFDFVSIFSESRRDEREFTNVFLLIIFLKRSNSRLKISFLDETKDFVSRERRELIMLTLKQMRMKIKMMKKELKRWKN